MLLREIMTSSVVTASPDTPVRQVAEPMRDRNVGSVVLADEADRPVGIVTDRDLTIGRAGRPGEAGDPIERCATCPVVTGEEDMELEEAAAPDGRSPHPAAAGRGRRALVGIVTLDDIAVRTGNLEVAQQMTADVARAAFPEFYFHQRGGYRRRGRERLGEDTAREPEDLGHRCGATPRRRASPVPAASPWGPPSARPPPRSRRPTARQPLDQPRPRRTAHSGTWTSGRGRSHADSASRTISS